MVTLYDFLESLAPHHLKTLAEFLTNIKARNFVGFALPSKLPLDASKYTRMELEEFDPTVVSSAVAQPGDPMWILVMDQEVWVYKKYNGEWDQYSRGAAGNFKFTSRTSQYPIGRLRKWGAELFVSKLEEYNHRPWSKKLNRVALNAWIRHAQDLFTNFDKSELNRFMSYSKLAGSDRIVMNTFITFIQSLVEGPGKMSSNTFIRRMLEGNYSIINIDLLTPDRLRNILRKIKEDLGDLYPTLDRVVGLVEELMKI